MLKSAACYGLYKNDTIIGFCAVCHQPHPRNAKIKRVHRLVILPDYQGIGLGTKFLNEVAQYYSRMGYDFSITTSAINLIMALGRNKQWICTHFGSVKQSGSYKLRTGVKIGSFFYVKNR